MSDADQTRDPTWAGFDWSRERYEDLIGRVVPDYHRQESLIAEALEGAAADGRETPLRILELGAGTGGLSRHLLTTFLNAEVTALDVSPAMLAGCREALAPFGDRARVVEADFGSADLGGGYHAVVSRLAIHHLEDGEKQALYRRIFDALLPGGLFVIGDLIAGETEAERQTMLAGWREYMISRGDDPHEWEQWLVGDDDYPATECEQLTWLEAAGFVDVGTIWSRTFFALTRAVKPC
ncbi:MAG: methyltransferase domain-containing protein [Thermoleophilia bacterium]|nr:methyltransferase domain-containing protein [Thermoleophilia bacterium]